MITMLEEPLADPAALSVTYRVWPDRWAASVTIGLAVMIFCRDTVGTWQSM